MHLEEQIEKLSSQVDKLNIGKKFAATWYK